jgi:hypothetical protein
MYYVITEKVDNIHASSYSYIIDIKTIKTIELYEKALINYNYTLHDTLHDAKQYLSNLILNDAINYTKMINEMDTKQINDICNNENNRFVIVYISKYLCINEGYYKIKLNEYLQLSFDINLSSDIKLATNNELETLTETNNTVIVRKGTNIKFKMPSETFYEEDSHDISLLGDDFNQKIARLLKIVITYSDIDLIPYFKNVFGNLEDYIINDMIDYFYYMILNIKYEQNQKNRLDYFYDQCKELINIAKDTKTILQYVY